MLEWEGKGEEVVDYEPNVIFFGVTLGEINESNEMVTTHALDLAKISDVTPDVVIGDAAKRGHGIMVRRTSNNIGYAGDFNIEHLQEIRDRLLYMVRVGVPTEEINNRVEEEYPGNSGDLIKVLDRTVSTYHLAEQYQDDVGTIPEEGNTITFKIEVGSVIDREGETETIILPYTGDMTIQHRIDEIRNNLKSAMGLIVVNQTNNIGYDGQIPFESIVLISQQIDKLKDNPHSVHMVKAHMCRGRDQEYMGLGSALYECAELETVFFKEAVDTRTLGLELIKMRYPRIEEEGLLKYFQPTKYGEDEISKGNYKITPYGSIGKETVV